MSNICITYRCSTTQKYGLGGAFKVTEVKSDDAIGLPIDGFLLMFSNNRGPSQAPLRDIGLQNMTLTLTFRGHLRSNVTVPLDSILWFPINV